MKDIGVNAYRFRSRGAHLSDGHGRPNQGIAFYDRLVDERCAENRTLCDAVSLDAAGAPADRYGGWQSREVPAPSAIMPATSRGICADHAPFSRSTSSSRSPNWAIAALRY